MLAWLRDATADIGADALIQVAVSIALVLAVILIAKWRHTDLGSEPMVAVGRGLAQVLLTGLILASILSLHVGWSIPVLLLMAAIAAGISSKRGGSYGAAFVGIALGAAVVVTAMVAMGALEPRIRDLVPVGSIVIAGCMRTASLAMERWGREAGQDDAVGASIRASLIPVVDGMKSLGFVWIPGVMTGLILAGASPVRAAFLQFVVVAMGFVAAAITSITATTWVQARHDNP